MFTKIILLSMVIRAFEGKPFYWILAWPGTVVHESLHYIVGLIMGARPSQISVVPEQVAANSEFRTLGYVAFTNITWFNAIPVAMAPLLAMPVLWMFTDPNMGWIELAVLASVAAQLWPSRADWSIAFSKPAGLLFWVGLPALYVLKTHGVI